MVVLAQEHPYKPVASPKHSALSLCCTNTFDRLLPYIPSMVGWRETAVVAEAISTRSTTKKKGEKAHLGSTHKRLWFRPLCGLCLGVEVIDTPVWRTRLLPEDGCWRKSVHGRGRCFCRTRNLLLIKGDGSLQAAGRNTNDKKKSPAASFCRERVTTVKES